MDTKQHLILVKGDNLTRDVASCQVHPETRRVHITFNNGKEYPYSQDSVVWLKNPRVIDPAHQWIYQGHQRLREVVSIAAFEGAGVCYWHLVMQNGQELCLPFERLTVVASCLVHGPSRNLLAYLSKVAELISLKTEEGIALLSKAYQKASFIDESTAFAPFSDPQEYPLKTHSLPQPLYPFGINASQFQAVERALTNQVSIIQGPPGTGKTQTILNILANLLIEGKTVQVVANNNSATENVLEKLERPEYGLGFLVASLGKSENKDRFFENQVSDYPTDFGSWGIPEKARLELRQQISAQGQALKKLFLVQEALAQLRQQEREWRLEFSHFEAFLEELGLAEVPLLVRRSLTSEQVLRVWHHARRYENRGRKLSLWFRLRCRLLDGIGDGLLFKRPYEQVEALLQRQFYRAKGQELAEQIKKLDAERSDQGHDKVLETVQKDSLRYVKAVLFDRWKDQSSRPIFGRGDLYRDPQKFLDYYPIVLSSTFSSTNSFPPGSAFDYVIVDEASQVDLATGCLALTCAKNAVVVGDAQQLPNVLPTPTRDALEELFTSTSLNQSFNAAANSFLQSICTTLPLAPQTLLREHYRCHPKIANFFNQKFYGGRLVVLTQDQGEAGVLSAFRTNPGNHERDRTNQRQIDVLRYEVLPNLPHTDEEVGIIAPYRNQVSALKSCLAPRQIEASTVHKFQGREKVVILLTTVDNELTAFSDDPNLLNVAVSRARQKFALITSAQPAPSGSPVGDLLAYIEYNNLAIVDSEVRSVFDYLYSHYSDARKTLLSRRRKISAFDSENLMFALLEDTLREQGFEDLGVVCHQPLRWLLRDLSKLTPEEQRYVSRPGTHLDFLVFNRVSKKPVLVVEVDGVRYHKAGTTQHRRDRMKDEVLGKYGIKLLRLSTNGSGEHQRLKDALARGNDPDRSSNPL